MRCPFLIKLSKLGLISEQDINGELSVCLREREYAHTHIQTHMCPALLHEHSLLVGRMKQQPS